MKKIYFVLLLTILWNLGFAQQPQIVVSGEEPFCAGGSVTLSTSQDYSSYEWYRANDEHSEYISTGETTSTITVTESGLYRVLIDDGQGYSNNIWDGDIDTETISFITPQAQIVLSEGPEYKVAVGDGEELNDEYSSSRPAPWGSYKQSSYQQYLIRADELTAMGIKPHSTIKEIAFYVEDAKNLNKTVNSFRIGVTQTTLNEMSEFVENGEFGQVFDNGEFREGGWEWENLNFTSGWRELPFNQHDNTDIVWDGESNVVIKVYYDNHDNWNTYSSQSYSYSNSVFRMTDVGYNASIFKYESSRIEEWNTITGGTLSTLRPNMRFKVEQAGGDILAACENEVTLKLSSSSIYQNITWTTPSGESSDDFIKVTGSTSQNISVETSFLGCEASDQVTVNFSALELEITADKTEFCDGDLAQLDAGEYSHYLWNTGETTQTVNVDESGIYKVEVRNTDGCVSQDTIDIHEVEKPKIYEITGDNEILPGQEIENFVYLGEFNGHHYYKNEDWCNWSQANRIAKDNGGHLLTIESDEENNFIFQIVRNSNNIWLGFTDKEDEGSWEWVTGESSIYTNWEEPNHPEDDISEWDNRDVAVLFPWNGQWGSANFDWSNQMILEIDYNSDIASVVCDEIELVATGDFDGFTWYKDGEEIGQEATLTVTGAGVYTASGNSELECVLTSEPIVITTVSTAPEVVITPTGDLCGADSEITLTATEGQGFTYDWNTGETSASINITAEDIFSVEVANEHGCAASGEFISRCDIYVSPEGDDANRGTMVEPYKSIQRAINQAVNGDIIIVKDGVYTENIDLQGKDITLASEYFVDEDESHIEATIIDGNDAGTVVRVEKGEVDILEVEGDISIIGLTIQNGRAGNEDENGGGITIKHSNVTLDNLIVKSNRSGRGGGILVRNSVISLTNSLIEDNVASYEGNAMKIENLGAESKIENLTFKDNRGSWSCFHFGQWQSYDFEFKNLNFEDNENHAMVIGSSPESTVKISNTEIFSGNDGIFAENGNYIFENIVAHGLMNGAISVGNNSTVALINSTLVNNGNGVHVSWGNCEFLVMNSIIRNSSDKEFSIEGGDNEDKRLVIYNSNIKGGENSFKSNQATYYELTFDESNYDTEESFISKEEGNFRLKDNSASVGAGVAQIEMFGETYNAPSLDFDRAQRPVPEGSLVDVGAYENRAFAKKEVYQISCNDGVDGSAEIEMLAGTAPYTYLWDDDAATTTAMISGMEPDRIYHVTITDDNGLVFQDSVWTTLNTVGKPNIYEAKNGVQILPGQEIENFYYLGEFEGHQYYLNDNWFNWHESKRIAEELGGHLLTIDSEAENNFIFQKINGGDQVWLGLTDRYEEGIWKWISKEDFSFTNWEDNEPRNDEQWENFDGASFNPWSGRWQASNLDWGQKMILEVDYDKEIADVICGSTELIAAGNLTDFVWYKEGVEVGTGATLTITEAGTYTVSGTKEEGCALTSDPVVISKVSQAPELTIEITGDLCNGDEAMTFNVGEGFASYLWSTGGATSSITTDEEGHFSVLVANEDGCETYESFASRCNLYVSPEGDDANRGTILAPFKTIQHAINMAEPMDTIIVKEGLYLENINFEGKEIALVSEYVVDEDESHIENTIIDGNQMGTVVNIYGEYQNGTEGEQPIVNPTSIIGFTVQNGRADLDNHETGGGITVNNSNVILENLVVKNNRSNNGGGILVNNSALSASDILIKSNIGDHGSGMAINDLSPESRVEHLTFEDNRRAWNCMAVSQWNSDLRLSNLNFNDNEGHAITTWGSSDGNNSITIANTKISGGQNGIRMEGGDYTLENIIAHNLVHEAISAGNRVSAFITNSTIVNNGRATQLFWGDCEMLIMNSILRNNSSDEFFIEGSDSDLKDLYIYNSNIKGGESSFEKNPATAFELHFDQSNYDVEESFVAPMEGNFRLKDNSAAVGAGTDSIILFGDTFITPDVDFYGIQRPVPDGSMVDVGACENRAFAKKTTNQIACQGEADGWAEIEMLAGTAPYTYLWDDEAGTTTAMISGMEADRIYHVTITDVKGVVYQDSAWVTLDDKHKPKILEAEGGTQILPGQEIENFYYLGEFEGHQYYMNENWFNWHESNEIAKEYGGHLLTIEGLEENNFIFQKINGGDQVWLGLTDQNEEGNWKWISKEIFDFINWEENEPRVDEEWESLDAAVFNPWSGRWNAANADWGMKMILEIDYSDEISEVICGSTELVATGNLINYVWHKDGEEAGVAGPKITITEPGTYTVSGNVEEGCRLTSDPIVITKVSETPELAVEITGDLCNGDEAITFDVGEGFDSYIWNTDETTSSITVTEEGYYSVKVTNEDGCESFETFASKCNIYVSPDGDDTNNGGISTPFRTIQYAIDIAQDRDTIIVKDGLYLENIHFNGKEVVVVSEYVIDEDESHIENTIIDGGKAGTVVDFTTEEYNNENLSQPSLIGFTIQNGRVEMNDYELGGGITVINSNPILRHLVVKNNRARNGGGIFVNNSAPIMRNILFVNNLATENGSGLVLNNIYEGAIIWGLAFKENKYAWNCVSVNHEWNEKELNLGHFRFVDNENQAMVIRSSWEGNNVVTTNGLEILSGNNGVFVEQGNAIFKNMLATGVENEVISFGNNTSVALINSTIVGNGQTARLNWGDSRFLVMNSILRNNFPKEIFVEGSETEGKSIVIANSNIKGGKNAIESKMGTIFDLQYENNYDRFEFFRNPEDKDFRLRDNSTSISSGIDSLEAFGRTFYAPKVDFYGKQRPVPEGSSVDVGAFENRSFSRKSIHHISCNGGDDGWAAIEMLAGVAPYAYQWDDENATQDSVLHITEANKVYHITITDAYGEVYQDSVWVKEPDQIEVFVSDSTNVSRQGFADGSATVEVTGGNAPYTFYWHETGETMPTVNNLEANEFYHVTVTDNKGCQANTSVVLKILSVVENDLCGFSSVNSEIQLNSTNVNAIASDYDGTIWFATDQGLSAFNGNEWHSVNQNANYRHIFKDKQGNLWLGSEWGEEGLTMFDGEEWYTYKSENGLAGDNVRGITEDNYGNIWIATDYGVSRFDGYQFTNFTDKDGLIQNDTRTIFADSKGYIWVGAESGVSRYKTISETQGESWESLSYENEINIGGISQIIEDNEGNLWFGTNWGWDGNSALIKFTGEQWMRVDAQLENMFISSVSSLLLDAEGRLWVGTNEGLAMFDGNVWEGFTYQNGLSANGIAALGQDAYGNIWVGYNEHDSGLSKYNGEEWKTLRKTDGVTKDYVNVLEMDQDDNLWVGTSNWEGGLIKFDGSSWNVFDYDDGFEGEARDITVDANGHVWIASGKGLFKYNNELFTSYNQASGMARDEAHRIQADSRGNIWISYGWENKGLDRFDGTNFQNFTDQNGLLSNDVSELDIDSQGNLWMTFNNAYSDGTDATGTIDNGNSGIVKYDGTNFTTYNPMFGLGNWDTQIQKLFVASDDKVWVSSYGNIASLEGEVWTYYDFYEMGYLVNEITTIGEDAEGNIWVSARNWDNVQIGMLKFNGTDWTVYSTDEGLPSNNILSVQDDKNGQIWFGTDNGLARYVKCLDEDVILEISSGTCSGEGDRQLTVTPTGDSPSYQYSLDGENFQTDNVFTGLSAGNYHLTVKNADGMLVADREVVITDPVPLHANIEGFNATCGSIANGEAICMPTGGTGPYTFLWDDANATTTDKVEGLEPGVVYTVTVTDANGCTATENIEIGYGAHLQFTDWSNVSCNGATDGMAVITPFGGEAPYQFLWDDANATQDSVVAGLTAGQYYHVTVTDATGCESRDSIILEEPKQISVESIVYNSCGNENAGGIEIKVSGGTVPYTFLWDDANQSTEESLYGVGAGDYTVTIKDAGGCEIIHTATVIEYTDVLAVEITDNLENNFCFGTTQLAATEGFTSYLWSNGQTDATIMPEMPGIYWVRAFNENGCSAIDSIQLNHTETYQDQNLCIVTVNTDNKNEVVWENRDGNGIVSYNIYKESNFASEYELMANVPFGETGVLEDEDSEPSSRSHIYAISSVDMCGNESKISEPHQTMLLLASVGLNGTVNLNWTKYGGLDFNTYNIYRGSSVDNMELLTSISNSQNMYIDNNPLDTEQQFYVLEIVNTNTCDPTYSAPVSSLKSARSFKSTTETYGSSRSNIIVIDDTNPTVTLASTATDPSTSTIIPIQITFSEEIEGFEEEDITVDNGNVSYLNTTDNINYTAQVIALVDGVVTVDINADVVEDVAGNGNTAATQFSISYEAAATNQQDSLALVAIYNSCGGENWSSQDQGIKESGGQWLVGPISTWDGVTLIDGRVTALDLGDKNLTGELPAEIGNLDNLGELDLSGNNITALPSEIGELDNLTTLELSENEITELPTTVGNLENLTSLELSGNELSTLPAEIGNLDNLATLDISGNGLDSLPDEIVNLTGLEELSLEGNSLSFEELDKLPEIPAVVIPTEKITLDSYPTVVLTETNRTLTLPTGHGGDTYQWYQDGELMDGETGEQITIAVSEESTFSCIIVNSNYPNTELETSVAIDNVQPTLAITSEASELTNSAFTIEVTFSKVVTGFELGDFAIANGELSNLVTSDNISYTALVTPADDGAVTVDVNEGVVADLSKNTNVAATQYSLTYDGTAPTLALTSTSGSNINTAAFTLEVTSSEAITGFELTDILVDNGTASNFVAADNNTSFSALITSTAEGAVTVDVNADVAVDLAGNGNAEATQFTITYTGLKNLEERGIFIYPIPTRDYLSIISNKYSGVVQVEIYNLNGDCIYNNEINSPFDQKIDATNFNSGIHILKMKIGNEVITSKISVIR